MMVFLPMPHDIVDKFSTHLKNVLTRALCFVVETNDKTIEPEHLLWALGTQKGCLGAELLKKVGVKQTELRALVGATHRLKTSVTVAGNAALHLSSDAKRIVEKAVLTANIYGHKYVGTEHLLSGILQVECEPITRFFTNQQIDLKELRHQLSIVLKGTSQFPDLASTIHPTQDENTVPPDGTTSPSDDHTQTASALDYFGRELTTLEAQADIDPVIGRDQEIERLMQILCRRTKNNPLLSGAPGVGKTAIVEGLAKHIVEGTVPPALQHKRIFAIDLALMIAGTMYRGEFEGRLRQVVEEVKKNENIILFIDEIHTIVGAGAASGSMDAANILKPALARGDIRCIGATTPDEFKKHIESDSALERRFQTILVEEPSSEDAISILQGVVPFYESFHRVRILPEAIEASVRLSKRFVQDRQLPDKAIDLIDEASSAVRLANGQPSTLQKRRLLEQTLKRVKDDKRQAVVEERFHDAFAFKEEEERVRRSIETDQEPLEHEPFPVVSARDIARVISRMTGIPVQELHEQKSANAQTYLDQLSTRILGQSAILQQVANSLARASSGVVHPKRPLASFLFSGPSGVGKTELAKAIAQHYFHDPKHLIRLDMSEYAEGFTVSKLIGSPAGYVGYKDQSNLTDRVKQHPYSVILFDEMEKAHRDVQNLLLQILEEGELADATGRTINFRNTMIVLTTNVGLEAFEQTGIGFAESVQTKQDAIKHEVRKQLEERFRPELMNRIETVCIFDPLAQETLTRIVEKDLMDLAQRLFEQQQLTLTLHPNVADHLTTRIDHKLGARGVRHIIAQEIETRIADRLTKQDRPRRLHIDVRKNTIAVTKPRS